MGLLTLFTNISCAQISADSAFKIIKKQVLFDDLSKVDILSITNVLPANYEISTLDTLVTSPNYDSWFFIVDDDPYANWNHPCRYIFVNSLTGYYTIKQECSLPDNVELNIIHSIVPLKETNRQDLFSFSNISRNTEDHSNDYAVIISGGYSKQKKLRTLL